MAPLQLHRKLFLDAHEQFICRWRRAAAGLKGDRLIGRGRHGMPAKRHDGALLELVLHFGDLVGARGGGVLVSVAGGTKILAVDGGNLSVRTRSGDGGLVLGGGTIVLSRHRVLPRSGVKALKQRPGFGCGED